MVTSLQFRVNHPIDVTGMYGSGTLYLCVSTPRCSLISVSGFQCVCMCLIVCYTSGECTTRLHVLHVPSRRCSLPRHALRHLTCVQHNIALVLQHNCLLRCGQAWTTAPCSIGRSPTAIADNRSAVSAVACGTEPRTEVRHRASHSKSVRLMIARAAPPAALHTLQLARGPLLVRQLVLREDTVCTCNSPLDLRCVMVMVAAQAMSLATCPSAPLLLGSTPNCH